MTSSYTVLEQLHEGADTVIYRGIRTSDDQTVVLKMPKSMAPSPREVAKLIHQYEIIKDVRLPGIVAVYDIERHQHGARLILEDFEGCSLKEIMAERSFDLCHDDRLGDCVPPLWRLSWGRTFRLVRRLLLLWSRAAVCVLQRLLFIVCGKRQLRWMWRLR